MTTDRRLPVEGDYGIYMLAQRAAHVLNYREQLSKRADYRMAKIYVNDAIERCKEYNYPTEILENWFNVIKEAKHEQRKTTSA